jgi:hypothetical protein
MLYTLIGNGNPNRKEVVESLRSLHSAVPDDEEMWMVFVHQEKLSDAHSDAVQWALKAGIPFEYVLPADIKEFDEWVEAADHVHWSKSPVSFAMKLTNSRPEEGEGRAVLVMSDDIDEDVDLLNAVTFCLDNDIPAYDLGGQMAQLSFEEVMVEVDEGREAPVVPEAVPSEWSRDDLQELTLVELKSIVNDHGLVPRDMRSKDSLIDSILGESVEVEPTEEPFEEVTIEEVVEAVKAHKSSPLVSSDRLYFITVIDTDGTTKMFPIEAIDALMLLG